MTEPAATSAELQEQIDDLRLRHDKAEKHLHDAREHRNTVAGGRVLGETDEEELAEANQALTAAEDEAASLASALALVESRRLEAIERERERERAEQIARGLDILASRAKADGRRRSRVLAFVQDDAEVAACDAEYAALRLALSERANAEEEAIEGRTRARVEALKRTAPPGQVPNYDVIERDMDAEIMAMRRRSAAEVDELFPMPDDSKLRAVADAHPEVGMALLDSMTRATLARGAEFLTPPHPARGVAETEYVGGATLRLYGSGELQPARERFYEMEAIVRHLAGGQLSMVEADRLARMRSSRVSAA